MNFNIGLLVILVFIGSICGISPPLAQAQTMSNQDYIITPDTNSQSQPTAGEIKPFTSEGVNFKVRSGFENTTSVLPFSVSLSSDVVDFGTLSPTNPIIRTVNLSVYSLSLYGYSIIASEDHALKSDKSVIPDTTCDNGACNQEDAAEWTNALTYGFGYRCDNVTGADCDSSFSKLNFYKRFADISNMQSEQSVMAGIGSKNKDVRMSYKVNISGSQAQGIYTNVITFIAIPNF